MDNPSEILRTKLSNEIVLMGLEIIDLEKQKVEVERRMEFYQLLEKDLERRGMPHVFG